MPYEINWEKNGTLVRFWGLFDFKVNSEAAIDIFNDPRNQDLKYVIWDTSDVSDVHMANGETSILSMQDQLGALRLPKIKLAMFAAAKDTRTICEQYCAHYQSRQAGWEFMISDSMENIRNWVVS